ncbi:hypothetical protein FI667_g2999, partial [Globisporangium splendens]
MDYCHRLYALLYIRINLGLKLLVARGVDLAVRDWTVRVRAAVRQTEPGLEENEPIANELTELIGTQTKSSDRKWRRKRAVRVHAVSVDVHYANGGCCGFFLRTGGAKAKGKKSPHVGSGLGGGKLKKNTQFKSLKKQDTRTVVIETKKKPGNNKKHAGARKPIQVSDEIRNFNERMAGVKKRKNAPKYQATAAKNINIAAPTFVMAAPTFAFGAPVPMKEAEGFQGFLTTMTAPKDVQVPRVNPEARKVKPVQPAYQGSNVFSVLEVDDGEELQSNSHMQQNQPFAPAAAPTAVAAPPPVPHFLQPATFSFQSGVAPAFLFQPPAVVPSSTFSSSLQAAAGADIDPDL